MARFLHIADARNATHIRRHGIRPISLRNGGRAVLCVPVVRDHAKTFQWARELRGSGVRSFVAVFFDMPDIEQVHVGRYGTEHIRMSAAAAHRAFDAAVKPDGQEVLVPRRIAAVDIKKVAAAPRITGWRYYPDAKGRAFWPIRGTIKAARRRAAINERMS